MKRKLLFYVLLLLSIQTNAADLLQIFQQALVSDPVYQKALIKAQVYETDVAISRAYLLPNIQFRSQPLVDAQVNSGAMVNQGLEPHTNTIRSNEMRLTVSQPIFDFALFSRLAASKLSAKEATARLNAELQELMLRVVKAYFAILRDQNNMIYLAAHKKTAARQLYEAEQKYKMGKLPATSLYSVRSTYSAAESDYIAAQVKLTTSKEYLVTLTGCDFTFLADLNTHIPFVVPEPANVEQWVNKAKQNNWLIKANQLRMQAAMEKIKQRFAKHLPTLSLETYYDNQPFSYIHGSLLVAPGASRTVNSAALLNVNVPIYSGGLVIAAVKKAQYYYKLAAQQFEYSLRNTVYSVRRSYLNIFSHINKVKHYEIAVTAAESALQTFKQRYYSGGANLVTMMENQERLVNAQMQLNSARYTYILQLIELKKAAGTLSTDDLCLINNWLKRTGNVSFS